MDIFAQTILVGAAMGIVGGGVMALLAITGMPQALALIVGVGLVVAVVLCFVRNQERRS